MKLFKIIFLIFILTEPIEASHLIGGYFSYQNNGNTKFEITLNVFKECVSFGGFCFDSDSTDVFCEYQQTGNVSVYLGNELFIRTIELNQPEVLDISQDEINECFFIPDEACVKKAIYSFSLTLPYSNLPYTIAYQRCCREENIDNIVLPGQTGFTYFLTIDSIAQHSVNASPRYDFLNQLYVCTGENFEIDFSTNDSDSLVYRLSAPYSGAGLEGGGLLEGREDSFNGLRPNPESPPPYSSVLYVSPFTAEQPFHFDTLYFDNGFLKGKTSFLGQFLLGISVDEFRDGEKIGTINIEIKVISTTCNRKIAPSIKINDRIFDNSFHLDICNADVLELSNVTNEFEENQLILNIDGKQKAIENFTSFETSFRDQITGSLIYYPDKVCELYFPFSVVRKTSESISIKGSPKFISNLSDSICLFTDDFDDDRNYRWMINTDTFVTNQVNETLCYQVQGNDDLDVTLAYKNQNGCISKDSIFIPFTYEYDLELPNIISKSACYIRNKSIFIEDYINHEIIKKVNYFVYNRWGSLVQEGDQRGVINAGNFIEGVYVVVIILRDRRNVKRRLSFDLFITN